MWCHELITVSHQWKREHQWQACSHLYLDFTKRSEQVVLSKQNFCQIHQNGQNLLQCNSSMVCTAYTCWWSLQGVNFLYEQHNKLLKPNMDQTVQLLPSYCSVFLRNSTRRWWGKPKSISITTKPCSIEREAMRLRNTTQIGVCDKKQQQTKKKKKRTLTSRGSTFGSKMSNKLAPCLSNSLVSSISRTGTHPKSITETQIIYSFGYTSFTQVELNET